MKERCIFVFFMIFNAILGLIGLVYLASGIYNAINLPKIVEGNIVNNIVIVSIIFGAYIISILILGACSWKKSRVLIAYFVLILLLMIVEIVMIILVKVAESIYYKRNHGYKNETFDLQIKISLYVYSISLGIAGLSFTFSAIYFCLLRKESDPQLYSEIRNMEELNAEQKYQNA